MGEWNEFSKQGEEILNFVDTYGVLRYEYLEKIFPGSDKIAKYLIKNQRLFRSHDEIYVSGEEKTRPDKCLIAALGVLADLSGKVQSHARTAPPTQISFITHSGDFYEIIYVGLGMERITTASFEMQAAARQKNFGAKRIVIVEAQSQMERLQIPGIARFALVQPDGSLSYFRGS